MLDSSKPSYADIALTALWGTMAGCLPGLANDIDHHALRISALCKRIESHLGVEVFISNQTEQYGQLYCGGQIEQSFRAMLARDDGQVID